MAKRKKEKTLSTTLSKFTFSVEVVLVVFVLVLLWHYFPLKKNEQELPQKSDNASLISNPVNGKVAETGEHFTPIEMAVIGTETLGSDVVTTYPQIPDGLELFDVSKFTEAQVNEYVGGMEYFLTFEYPGMTDSSAFKDFYENFAEKNGWKINLTMSAVNGIKVTMEKENVEMRVVTYKKQNEATKELFVREKVRIFESK